jgi:hypothetical protein
MLTSSEQTMEQERCYQYNIHAPEEHKMWIILGMLCLSAILLGGSNIRLHLRYFTKPMEQRQIIRILIFPILFCVLFWFGFYYYQASTFLNIAAVFYEVFTIYAFFKLLLAYTGEMANFRKILSLTKRQRCCCLPIIKPASPSYMKIVMACVLQYTLIKPVLAIVIF